MYQPLTDRARKVMLSANQEALRFNHETVATEHVLLALVVEGRGVGANVLRYLGGWLANYPLDPAWLSWGGDAALKLAQRIHALWRWDALPELADVLERAGCTDDEILAHCRKIGEHSHHCWVVDLLLTKSARPE